MVKSGCIPEEIIVVSAPPRKLGIYFGKENIEIIPSFVVDALSDTMLETAKKWANWQQNIYDPETMTYKIVKYEPKINQYKNEPISNIRVIGLDIRNEGGRAYKVITKENYYFDLREDVLLDVIYNDGISKGGVLNGDFIWGRVVSQMKLIRYNSKLYDELIEAGKKRFLKKIEDAKLEPFTIYRTKSGKEMLFLDWVSTIEVRQDNSGKYIKKNIDMALLCYDCLYSKKDEDIMEEIKEKKYGYYRFSIQKSHSFVEKIKSYPEMNINKIVKEIKQKQGARFKPNFGDFPYFSPYLNMVPYGKKPILHKCFKDIVK